MGIVLTPFRWADDGDKLTFIHQLMEEAFPAAERRSRRDFEALLASEPRFLLYLIYRDEALVGFLSTWHLEDFYYGEHFAILPTERNRGTGREVLRLLKRETSPEAPFVFEVEPPLDEWSKRRLAFYESMGMQVLSRSYIQPSYGEDRPPIPLYLMGNEWAAKGQDSEHYAQELYRHVYRKTPGGHTMHES